MKGLDISKEFYRQYGEPMLDERFADVKDLIAVGLAGEGSECFGFDDELSRDHDFDAGFCLWVTRKDCERFGFQLERAYSKLPKEFMGLKRGYLSPVGGNRRGVIVIDDFYTKLLGASTAPDSIRRWLYTPSSALATASNGEVFSDPLGEFSKVRNELLLGYPEDIRLKKLAAHTVMMSQSGQYNFSRSIKRGDIGAAQLSMFEFIKHAISSVYLLNNKYEPYYKWAFRGMRDLPVLGLLSETLTSLSELDNGGQRSALKAEIIEDISLMFIEEFKKQSLSESESAELEAHAYQIQNKISDGEVRNLHIMEGI